MFDERRDLEARNSACASGYETLSPPPTSLQMGGAVYDVPMTASSQMISQALPAD